MIREDPKVRAEWDARAARIAAALIERLHAMGWSGVTVEKVESFDVAYPRWRAVGTVAGETFEYETHGSPDGALYMLPTVALEVAERGL